MIFSGIEDWLAQLEDRLDKQSCMLVEDDSANSGNEDPAGQTCESK